VPRRARRSDRARTSKVGRLPSLRERTLADRDNVKTCWNNFERRQGACPDAWRGQLKELYKSLRQLVVFPLKRFVQDLVRSRIERFHSTLIAGANQDRGPAVDISFVAPLPKCHLFHALSHAPLFADFTNGGFVSGGHCPIPSASPKPGQSARYVLSGCVSYFTLGTELRAATCRTRLPPLDCEHSMNYVHGLFSSVGAMTMVRALVEEAATLASLALFLGMIAIWAQVIATL